MSKVLWTYGFWAPDSVRALQQGGMNASGASSGFVSGCEAASDEGQGPESESLLRHETGIIV